MSALCAWLLPTLKPSLHPFDHALPTRRPASGTRCLYESRVEPDRLRRPRLRAPSVSSRRPPTSGVHQHVDTHLSGLVWARRYRDLLRTSDTVIVILAVGTALITGRC